MVHPSSLDTQFSHLIWGTIHAKSAQAKKQGLERDASSTASQK
jgi:hypothetical protein